jgi:8-oxo-dGTP pyrophosphatase MutT (NUDIX family)
MDQQQRLSRLSSGVVIIRQSDIGPLLLMLRSFANWDFPKGAVEPGEEPHEAAVREVREETTICDLQFPWGLACIDTGPYAKGKITRYYIGSTQTREVALPVNPSLGHSEHDEWRWVTLEQAHQMASPRVISVLNWAEATCPQFAEFA